MSLFLKDYKTGGFVYPDNKDVSHYKRFLQQKHLENKQLGRFTIDLSQNPDVNVTYKSTPQGDCWVVYPVSNPDDATLVSVCDEYVPQWKQKIDKEIVDIFNGDVKAMENPDFIQRIKLRRLQAKKKRMIAKFQKEWGSLPDAMIKVMELAKKMQNDISKKQS